jgi:hypothetical protein
MKGRSNRQFDAMPEEMKSIAVDALDQLSVSPTQRSIPTAFPYPPKCQLCHFHFEQNSQKWMFTFLFQFSQDEQTLEIFALTLTEKIQD